MKKTNIYKAMKGEGGLHTKKKGKGGKRITIGTPQKAKTLAKKGRKIILGSGNRGTDKLDGLTY